jgi:magnesium chelatase subunit D
MIKLNKLKLAMIINAINPGIGGLLIRGPKGSGKTTAVRALRDVLPNIEVTKDCPFNCNPHDSSYMCENCSQIFSKSKTFSIEERNMRVVDLPLGATEDRVIGSLDIEKAIKQGIGALEPGILAAANQNILYVDEINLLPDHIADDLLDAAATGWNVVEREGISVSHPSRFIFIGTMNPEEGQLRPQLLDRFPLSVTVERIASVEERMEVVRRNLEFEVNPESFLENFKTSQEELKKRIKQARKALSKALIPPKLLQAICQTCLDLKVDGLRPDIVISKAATTLAAFENREVSLDDVLIASELALNHRTRAGGFLEPATPEEIRKTIGEAVKNVGYEPEKQNQKKAESTSSDSRKKRHGRAMIFLGGDTSKKEEDFFEKHKKLSKAWKRMSRMYVTMSRILGQVIFAFGRKMKSSVKGMPTVKGVVKSRRSIQGDPESEGKLLGLKKVTGIPSITHTAKTPRLKKGFSLFRSFKGSTEDSGILSKLSIKARKPQVKSGFSGKRAEVTTRVGRGRASGWRFPKAKPRDIHLPATIRAAARKRKNLKKGLETALQINLQDVREKLRRLKAPMTIIFVLDLSGSMLLKVEAIKKSILKLHGDAYHFRDRVGIVALKDTGAIVAQHPITNLRVVANKLVGLKIGGFTPLAAGMLKAWEVLRESKRRAPSTIPVMVIITDGSANVPLNKSLETGQVRSIDENGIIVREYEDLAVSDTVSVSKMIRREGFHTIVINTNPHIYGRETYGLTVTELITKNTKGRLHMMGRMRDEQMLVENIIEKVAEGQRIIAHETSSGAFD